MIGIMPSINSTSFLYYRHFLCIVSTIPRTFAVLPLRCISVASPSDSLTYGPSLSKGKALCPIQAPKFHAAVSSDTDEHDEDTLFREEDFTRVFEISALRVRASDCFLLESRLRGHLLNWPRIRNIARVPGDEVDEEVAALLKSEDGGDDADMNDLERRIYGRAKEDGDSLSPVLYREKLVKEFNAKAHVKFRNLARISRSRKRGTREKVQEKEKRKGKNDFAVVEVVGEEDEGDVWRGLLGNGGRRTRWMGSTRLLLLDERYADKEFEDLPQAIKVALQETVERNTTYNYELVKCKLTVFYDYWPMNEMLSALLPTGMNVPSAFESVGHIAHLNLKEEHLPYKKLIAKLVLDKNQPKIQTVVNKTEVIHNKFRTMQLETLAGNHSLVTMVVENGLRFHVDLANVFWNSRIATERQRITRSFTRDDVVCDVFAGVGPLSLAAARTVKRVYANDLNPDAVNYLVKNCVENKLEKKIKVFNMDGRRFIKSMFATEKGNSISQVLMNLPNSALDFLDAFKGIFRKRPKTHSTKLPIIHLYAFSKAEDPEFDFHERIRIALEEVAVDVKVHRVLLVSPGKWMLCGSFTLPASVAYADPQDIFY